MPEEPLPNVAEDINNISEDMEGRGIYMHGGSTYYFFR